MKQRCRHILTLLIPVILVSCFPKLHTVKENNLSELEKPGSETARVVFIRPQKGFTGQGVVAIYDGNDLIGGLSASSYFAYDAKPGEHLFGCYSSPPLVDFLKADIDGGRTYYAQCSYQDRVLMLASKFIAIKKDSDIMEALDDILPKLRYSVLTDEGVSMYAIQSENSRKYIIDKRASMVTYRMDIEDLRQKWLEEAKAVQKPILLTEDGIK